MVPRPSVLCAARLAAGDGRRIVPSCSRGHEWAAIHRCPRAEAADFIRVCVRGRRALPRRVPPARLGGNPRFCASSDAGGATRGGDPSSSGRARFLFFREAHGLPGARGRGIPTLPPAQLATEKLEAHHRLCAAGARFGRSIHFAWEHGILLT